MLSRALLALSCQTRHRNKHPAIPLTSSQVSQVLLTCNCALDVDQHPFAQPISIASLTLWRVRDSCARVKSVAPSNLTARSHPRLNRTSSLPQLQNTSAQPPRWNIAGRPQRAQLPLFSTLVVLPRFCLLRLSSCGFE